MNETHDLLNQIALNAPQTAENILRVGAMECWAVLIVTGVMSLGLLIAAFKFRSFLFIFLLLIPGVVFLYATYCLVLIHHYPDVYILRSLAGNL